MGKSSRQKGKVTNYNAAADKTSESSDLPYNKQLSGEQHTPKTRNFKYFLAGIVSLITFLVYLPSLRNEFLAWDDSDYVTNNPMIRSMNLDFIRTAFFEFHASNWHPLTWISHALDYAIWGLNPVGHHLTNVIIHAINTALVVMVTFRLLELYRKRSLTEGSSPWLQERGILITAGVAGLLFGLHPVHVESVAWVAERKDLLCALFFMISTLAYVKYVRAISHEKLQNNIRLVHFNISYLLCLGFFVFALLSKPMAVSLPFVLLIIDWYPANRIRSMKSLWSVCIEKLPFILLSLGSSVLTFLAQKDAMEIMKTVPLQSRLLVAAHSIVAYLQNIFFPINLSPFYSYPDDISVLSLKYFLPVLLVLGISAYLIVTALKNKLFFSIWFYYLITLMPVLGIIQVGSQSMADRYAYLPSLSLFVLIGLLLARIYEKIISINHAGLVKVGSVIVASALITLGYLTVRQMDLWQNDLALWSYAIDIDKSATAYWNRGIAFTIRGQFDKAIDDYNMTISIDSSYYKAYLNRGMAYSEMGLV